MKRGIDGFLMREFSKAPFVLVLKFLFLKEKFIPQKIHIGLA